MRVAILTERARGSGAAEAAWNLAVALQTDGHEVGYFYAESSGPAQDTFPGAREIGRWQEPNRQIRKMKSVEPGTRPWLDAHLRRRAMLAELRTETLAALSDFAPDVVHLHNVAAIGGHVLASSIVRRWPTVWTAHDRFPFELFHNTWEMRGEISTTWEYSPGDQPARAGLEMFCALPVALQFLTPSQWLADIAAKNLDGSRHRVSVVPNLIPESTPSTTTRLADALNVDAVALAVIPKPGYPLKGFDTVRAALTRANEQMSDRAIGLVVTTDKPLGLVDEHIYTTPELFERGLVRQSGYLDKARMAVLYRAVDVVTIASWIENLPNVAIEAAAAGRPVVASAVGGIPEVVRPGETGWLIEPGDDEAMAAALVGAMDAETRQLLGDASLEEYRRSHGPAIVLERHVDVYADAVDRWGGDPAHHGADGLDFSESRFSPPRTTMVSKRQLAIRCARAALRRTQAALGRVRRWYHRRRSGRL